MEWKNFGRNLPDRRMCIQSVYRNTKKTSLFLLLLVGLYAMWIVAVSHQIKNPNAIFEDSRIYMLNITHNVRNNTHSLRVEIVKEKNSSNEAYHTCHVKTKNVAFLKIHKAGSSTVMNIFLRYGITNDLNFVLPNTLSGTFNYLGNGVTLKRENVIPLPANQTFNLLCNHVVYNREAFAQVMPNNTEYIAVIRDPYTRFLSAATYFGFFGNLEKEYGLRTNNLDLLLNKFFSSHTNINTGFMHVNNKMAFDFGLPTGDFQNETAIKAFLTKISSELKLVMLLEYIDESIILMKRYLCWDMKDVLYISTNVNKGSKANVSLNVTTSQLVKDWNKADFMLYEYFVKRFWKQVLAEGPEFHLEVVHFKQVRSQVVEFCRNPEAGIKTLNVEASKWNPTFYITSGDCKIMNTIELAMVTDLIKQAFQKINMRIEKSGLYYADTNELVLKPVHA